MTRPSSRCRICQCEKANGEQWFLVIGNYWEDRLRVLPWSERLAKGEGMHAACSPSHVQQLVAHWLATGSLAYPFAQSPASATPAIPLMGRVLRPEALVPDGRQALGELAVDRESLKRLLLENPESLVPVLDALVGALYVSEGHERELQNLFPEETKAAKLMLSSSSKWPDLAV